MFICLSQNIHVSSALLSGTTLKEQGSLRLSSASCWRPLQKRKENTWTVELLRLTNKNTLMRTNKLKTFLQQTKEGSSLFFLSINVIFIDRWWKIPLTQSLVIVLCITCQSEQCRSHFLTALVQVLAHQTHHVKHLKTKSSFCLVYRCIIAVCTPITLNRSLIESVRLSVHLYEFSIALIAGRAVIVLQKLSQETDALLHLLNGIHPLWHLLCSLLILQRSDKFTNMFMKWSCMKQAAETSNSNTKTKLKARLG